MKVETQNIDRQFLSLNFVLQPRSQGSLQPAVGPVGENQGTRLYGGPQLKTSRQKQKLHGKTKNLTAKTNTSRQNQKPHRKTKDLTAKPNTSQQKPNTSKANTHGKTKAILFLL